MKLCIVKHGEEYLLEGKVTIKRQKHSLHRNWECACQYGFNCRHIRALFAWFAKDSLTEGYSEGETIEIANA